jgi:uncharacterized protein
MRFNISLARFLLPGFFFFPFLGNLASADVQLRPDPLILMQRNHEASRVDDSKAKTVFKLVSASGKIRLQEAETITRRDAEDGATSRLARFLAPADVKGTAVLTVEQADRDDDIWLYLPALGKVRRLQGSNTREAYMGTDLSYGDVIGHAPEDWTHTVIGDDVIEGVDCWIVESLPRTKAIAKNSGYSKRVNWIRSDIYVAMRAELYDSSGRLTKRIQQTQITKVSAKPVRWQPMAIDVENVRTKHRTEVRFSGFKANTGLEPELFSPRALEKAS